MKNITILTAVALALTASSALAQGRGGGGGPPAGVPGGGAGAGAGPPMTVPGRTADPSTTAQEIASQQGQFGRDFAEQQQMNQAEQAQMMRDRAAEFVASSEERKLEAFARRDAARAGQPINMSSKEIRAELKEDMEEWRETFRIGRSDWQQLRDEILVDAGELTPEQWADRRAQWFEIRDAWIAEQTGWAQSHGNNAEDTGG